MTSFQAFLLLVLGVVVLSAGAGLVYIPAGIMVAGAGLICGGLLLPTRDKP